MRKTTLIVYIVCFELLWFACVLYGHVLAGLPVLALALLFTLFHFSCKRTVQSRRVWGLSVLLGLSLDQLAYHLHLISFTGHPASSPWVPLWIVALWIGFVASVPVNFAWLVNKPRLSMLLGALFGPLAYWGAQRLGAVTLTQGWLSVGWFAAAWALLMPLLLRLNQCQRSNLFATLQPVTTDTDVRKD